MLVRPEEDDWILAREVWDRFSELEGAQHIASEFALAHLACVLRSRRPKRALELGAGIGTITSMILAYSGLDAEVVTTEANEFCLRQLDRNIDTELKPRLRIIDSADDLAGVETSFDLIVLDGHFGVEKVNRFLDAGTVCFVEGARQGTRDKLNAELGKRGLACEFTNHIRGRKLVHFALRRGAHGGWPRPSIKFNKAIKGCWVGEVTALGVEAS